MTDHPDGVSLGEFARQCRFKRSYATQLKHEGRLVLTEDGKRVIVGASLERIEATRDPGKSGVVDRHAAARAAKAGEGEAGRGSTPARPSDEPGDLEDEPEQEPGGKGYQYWRERKERANALSVERENALAEGKLLVAGEVEAQVAAAATTLRTRLESLPATLGPQLAAITDEGQVIATLAETIEHALEEMSRQFAAIATQQGSSA